MSSRGQALVFAVIATWFHVLGAVMKTSDYSFFVGVMAGLFTMGALNALGER